MKILHINYSDSGGGAAIAAYRHHEAMRKAGIDSKMLVINKYTEDEYVYKAKIPFYKVKNLCFRILTKLQNIKYNFFASWSENIFGYDLSKEKIILSADIIILHWINFRTLSVSSIEKILKLGKPTYWFMHDMWPITGGCHHSLNCEKFKTHCEKCPMFHNKNGSKFEKDLSYHQFNKKIKSLASHDNLHFITPSEWLADKVRESAIFKNHPVFVVRNVLDTDVFIRIDKTKCRKKLGLPVGKNLILFGAENISNPYKGWNYLKSALEENIPDTECVIYGASSENVYSQLGLPVHKMGKISSTEKLVWLYNACDLFVTPSLADNYPNVIIEATSCGLPVVAFATGGIKEMIIDDVNGFLVREYKSSSLREMIIKALGNIRSDNLHASLISDNSYGTILNQYEFLTASQC